MIKIADFFSGIGGISAGFIQANKNFVTVFANDADKYCKQTYDSNHNIKLTLGNIQTLDINGIPDFDVFCGGFPCQPFSLAGDKKGFDDSRGQVFFDIIKILKIKKPACIFLENVKNLVTHDKKNTFNTIKKELENLGYTLNFKVLNSCDYGNVPQNRERIYIIGFLNSDVCFEFPEPIKKTMMIRDCLENKVDECFYYKQTDSIYPKLREINMQKDVMYQYRRYYIRENKSNLCPTLTANMGTGGHNVPIIIENSRYRKLSPRECFNFQGFPSTFILPTNLSNSQLYKQAGNSVTVPVIKRLAEKIYDCLKSKDEQSLDIE